MSRVRAPSATPNNPLTCTNRLGDFYIFSRLRFNLRLRFGFSLFRLAPKGRITIGFRPEALEIIPEGESTDLSIPIKLDFVEELGSDSFLYGKLVGEGDLGSSSEDVPESGQIVVRAAPNTAPAPGSVFHARIVEGGQHNFSASTGTRLP